MGFDLILGLGNLCPFHAFLPLLDSLGPSGLLSFARETSPLDFPQFVDDLGDVLAFNVPRFPLTPGNLIAVNLESTLCS